MSDFMGQEVSTEGFRVLLPGTWIGDDRIEDHALVLGDRGDAIFITGSLAHLARMCSATLVTLNSVAQAEQQARSRGDNDILRGVPVSRRHLVRNEDW